MRMVRAVGGTTCRSVERPTRPRSSCPHGSGRTHLIRGRDSRDQHVYAHDKPTAECKLAQAPRADPSQPYLGGAPHIHLVQRGQSRATKSYLGADGCFWTTRYPIARRFIRSAELKAMVQGSARCTYCTNATRVGYADLLGLETQVERLVLQHLHVRVLSPFVVSTSDEFRACMDCVIVARSLQDLSKGW